MQVYIHIPFCRRKCSYCSFVSFPGYESFADEYIDLLITEAGERRSGFREMAETLFIGGGTPSLLSVPQLKRMISGLSDLLSPGGLREFTVEANPGTLTEEWLEAAAESGVTRLSLGMQAYQPEVLQTLGRIHQFREVCDSVRLARRYGIRNLNLDLMFGIPGQSLRQWKKTLEEAILLEPEHISAYGLIPEEGTPLFDQLGEGKLSLPEVETERDMYDLALELLSASGYRQYEISNFAKPGYECIHNIGYWTQVPYVGLGLSAASMEILSAGKDGMRCRRRTNPSSLDEYRTMVLRNSVPSSEEIDPVSARFETLMLGFRMNKGVSERRFASLHGISMDQVYGSKLRELEKKALLYYENGSWKMTRKGFDIQNGILVELMDD